MLSDPARGRLRRRLSAKDALFLSCVILSLTALAVAFSSYQAHDAYSAYCQASAHAGEQGCKAIKPVWEPVFSDPVVFFAFATALFTGGLVMIGAAQAGLFWWQLDLIGKGLADTKDAADAAKKQADLARESLIASQRAWIKVGKPIIHVSVHTARNSMWGWVGIPIENAGNAPALKINPQIWLGGFGPKGFDSDRFHARCEEIRKTPPDQLEFFLFPGESVPATDKTGYGHSIYLGDADFADVVCVTPRGLEHIQPLLMGCVTYVFPTDQTRHQSRFVYEVHRAGRGSFGLEEAEIMADEITLKRHDFGSSFYVD